MPKLLGYHATTTKGQARKVVRIRIKVGNKNNISLIESHQSICKIERQGEE